MESYSEKTGLPPDFVVSYRFLSSEEGGRVTPPHQHTRWDFLYEGDTEGASMIWPEFIDEGGRVLPEGEVPMEGLASMFIVVSDRTHFTLIESVRV